MNKMKLKQKNDKGEKEAFVVEINKQHFPKMTEDEIVKAFAEMIDLGGGYKIEKLE